MSKDLKDRIDQAEEEQQNRAFLEKTIEKLKTEVASLKNKLKAQKPFFKVKPVKHIEETDESEELIILKEMISSLRQELNQKTDEKEALRKKVDELTVELTEVKGSLSASSLKDEMLSRTQNSLNNLIQDYGKLENENKLLKKNLSELREEIEDSTRSLTTLKAESSDANQLKKDIITLKDEVSYIEKTNKQLMENLQALRSKEGSIENLEEVIDRLRKSYLELEKENQTLSEDLDRAKREKLKIFKYESKISELNRHIEELQQKNIELKHKDSILLAKTITAMEIQERKKKLKKEPAPKVIVKPIPEEKIVKLKAQTIEKVEEKPVRITPEIIDTSKITEKGVESEQLIEPTEVKGASSDFEIKRKWKCPKCGNSNKAHIREIDDKTRLIYAYPKIYAKKYRCGQCSAEWC